MKLVFSTSICYFIFCGIISSQNPQRKIICYFTRPVDTIVSSGVNAIYLNNSSDDTLVQYINRAQESIDIAIYNTTNSGSVANIAGALNTAYANGIKIRVIYDGSVGNTMIPNLDTNIKRVASPQGGPFNIMHNKFVVFDADALNPDLPIVWSGSMNWTTSQINGTDANNIIIIQDQTLAQAYKTEFEEMWGSTTLIPNPGIARFGSQKLNNTQHIFSIGGNIVECYFSPSDSVNSEIISAINSANTDIEFASMVITRNDVANAITTKVGAGVLSTYGLTDDSVLTSQWTLLKNGMLPNTMKSHTGQFGIMHNKFLIVDESNISSDPLVLTGSHNWSTSANAQNDENTLIIHDDTIANQYFQAFSYLFAQDGGMMNIYENAFENWAFVYPNPIREIVNINLDVNGEMKIYNLLGESVGTWQLAIGKNEIDLKNLPSGVYFLVLLTENGGETKKIVKQ